MAAHRGHVPPADDLAARVDRAPADRVAAGLEEAALDAERPRLGHAPRVHPLAAVPVAELALTLHDEHAGARLRHHRGERGATEATTDYGEVVQGRSSLPPRSLAAAESLRRFRGNAARANSQHVECPAEIQPFAQPEG